jgi:RNA polymerase sigma factor (TIGR02999 family)
MEDDLTHLLQRAIHGDDDAENRFFRAVYQELRATAHALAQRSSGGSIQPTALVHEVFLKMFRRGGLKKACNRRYFFTVAVDQMRKLLIDHHRRRRRLKAGGGRQKVSLDNVSEWLVVDFAAQNGFDMEALESALSKLKAQNERQHKVVLYKFYAGLTNLQTARLLCMGESTVEADWRLARAKLYDLLKSHSE